MKFDSQVTLEQVRLMAQVRTLATHHRRHSLATEEQARELLVVLLLLLLRLQLARKALELRHSPPQLLPLAPPLGFALAAALLQRLQLRHQRL